MKDTENAWKEMRLFQAKGGDINEAAVKERERKAVLEHAASNDTGLRNELVKENALRSNRVAIERGGRFHAKKQKGRGADVFECGITLERETLEELSHTNGAHVQVVLHDIAPGVIGGALPGVGHKGYGVSIGQIRPDVADVIGCGAEGRDRDLHRLVHLHATGLVHQAARLLRQVRQA